MKFSKVVIEALFLVVGIYQNVVSSQTTSLELRQVLNALDAIKTKKTTTEKFIKDVQNRRVDFELNPVYEDILRKAGATNEIIEVVRKNYSGLKSIIIPRPISTDDGAPPVINKTPNNTPTPVSTPTATPTATPTPVLTPIPTPVPSPSLILTPTPVPSPSISAPLNLKETKNSIGMEFVQIPSGSFMMGSKNGELDEKPVHQVTILKSFWMGKTEVTQGQWIAVMKDLPKGMSHFEETRQNSLGDNKPVLMVSWVEVKDYITKLNAKGDGTYRLPTEAEWEYAARAGSTGDYVGNLNLLAWYSANSGTSHHSVATKQPNDWGLYDIFGNVWEWVEDSYISDYYLKSPVNDPISTLSTSKTERVNRGGSWIDMAGILRSGNRGNNLPSYRDSGLGFRLIKIE